MIRNYLKTTFRFLTNNYVFSLIDILGLTLGITSFIIILQYINFEKSYDKFLLGDETIYRVESQFWENEQMTDSWATSSIGYGPAMLEEFDEVTEMSRIFITTPERVVKYRDRKYRFDKVLFADSSFLRMFPYEFVIGNRKEVLSEPNSVVISESNAKMFFGDENPIGKPLVVTGRYGPFNCTVSGVYKDLPENSTLQFDFLVNWNTVTNKNSWLHNFWYLHEAYTFVKLKDGVDPGLVEAKFPQLAEKYKTRKALINKTWKVKLVPFEEVHLNAPKGYEIEEKGDRDVVKFLTIIAFMVIGIAYLNHINLATSNSLKRSKEVGIRKTVGAGRSQITFQFLFEAIAINLIAVILAFLLLPVISPMLNSLFGKEIIVPIWNSSSSLTSLLLIVIAATLISGIYPALIKSSYKPVIILKGGFYHSNRGARLRTIFVVLEFVITIILITGILVVSRQIKHMQKKSRGFDISNVMAIQVPIPQDYNENSVHSFRNFLLQYANVENFTKSSSIPGLEIQKFLSNRRADGEDAQHRLYEMLRVDYNFLKTYRLQLQHGRFFSRERSKDFQEAVVINEKAAQNLGFANLKDALHKEIWLEGIDDQKFRIMGIVKNFNQRYSKFNYRPIMFFMAPQHGWISLAYFSVRFRNKPAAATIIQIEQKWKELFPSSPFDNFFVSDLYASQYRNDKRFRQVLNLFTITAIFISCLGLFALSIFIVQNKKKEVGIRKVLGGSVTNITFLLIKQILKNVLMATVIAWPLSWFVLNKWLQNYAYRIDLKIWPFLFAGLAALVIAMLTVGWQVVRAATANPVESIRYE